MANLVQVREDYINKMRDLQRKRVKNRDEFILLALLLAYIVDYLETKNNSKYLLLAPFLPEIKNIDNAKVVVKAIDEALDSKGKLADYIKDFKEINNKTLSTLNNIIPQIEAKKKKNGETKRLNGLKNDAEIISKGNASNLIINEFILGKTMKQWNTQRDSRVRKTLFHEHIDRQIKPINELFKVGDVKAMFPSDLTNLQPFDAYGCRCYLTYFN